MSTFPPWPGADTALALKGGAAQDRHDSVAVCDDGRVIYVWTDGNTLKQSHYPTVEDFYAANNAGATAGVTLTLDGVGFLIPKATVWRHPTTGELYLFTSIKTTVPDARNRVWRSPSGNGESSPSVPDWTLHGTIQTATSTLGADWHVATFGVGEPYVTGTGRWLLPCTYLQHRDTFKSGVFTSDDEGATWTNRHVIGYYILGGIYGDGLGRNIVEVSGSFYFGAHGNVESAKVAVSSDNGTTWATTELSDGAVTADFPIDNAGATRYRLRYPPGGPGTIQSGSDFLSASGWTNVLTLSLGTWGFTPSQAILQRINESNDAFMWNGRLLSATYTPPPDITPPDTIITDTDIDDEILAATFTFESTEENSTFECSLDGGAWTSCTTPITYTGLAYGDHVFAVRAIDESDNVDPTPAEFEFVLEEPPDVTPAYYDRGTPTVFPDTLGCSQHVAYIQAKCNGPRLCELSDVRGLYYDRRLDDVSEAWVEIPISGDVDNPCCVCLADIEPWCHQLTIVREGDGVVWTGPIQKVIYGYNSVRIEAADKLAWLKVRVNELPIEYEENTTISLTEIATTVVEVAMADDDSPCFLDCIIDLGDGQPAGTDRSVVFPAFEGPTAFDDFQTLADVGIDYTVINHCLILGPERDASRTRAIGTLRDEHILGELSLIKDGTQQANRFFVRYEGDDDCEEVCTPQEAENPCDLGPGQCCPCPAMIEGATECYGTIERVLDNLGIQDIGTAQGTATRFLNTFRLTPRFIEFPSGTRLAPDTPWKINDMIPGQRIDVALSKLCLPIYDSFKLQQVTVEDGPEGEKISVDLMQMGTIAGDE